MRIKKLIIGLILSSLLGSEMAAADWGDDYYCRMSNHMKVFFNGRQQNERLETFQFKLDKARNAMVFGSKGLLKNEVYVINVGMSDPKKEIWVAQDMFTKTFFNQGQFAFAIVGPRGVFSITADCKKF